MVLDYIRAQSPLCQPDVWDVARVTRTERSCISHICAPPPSWCLFAVVHALAANPLPPSHYPSLSLSSSSCRPVIQCDNAGNESPPNLKKENVTPVSCLAKAHEGRLCLCCTREEHCFSAGVRAVSAEKNKRYRPFLTGSFAPPHVSAPMVHSSRTGLWKFSRSHS